MDVGKFRTEFPEFASTDVYPSSMITFWANLAERQVKQSLWTDLWTTGVALYVAHEITLAAQNVKASKIKGSPGQQGGIANTKTVGSVSVGYDSQATSEKDAGYWNLTTYGKQFIRLVRIMGAGAIQL